MKNTKAQSSTKTLADLYRALDAQRAVTITYVDKHGVETIRTVEVHEVRTTSEGIEIVAMCRLRATEMQTDPRIRSAERTFNVSQIAAYTVHRMAYVLVRPEPTKYVRPAPAPTTDAQALFFYELARDQDDADHTPRALIQADTDLAA
ncbi:WYL domain-containing protein [Streptomyces sp. NPDC058239]|uniref:WYL domain-containing protein n=1 Tax=Streptomyces sp. NPDC058239 TaxID=3346395 RepID=UPI0036EC1252